VQCTAQVSCWLAPWRLFSLYTADLSATIDSRGRALPPVRRRHADLWFRLSTRDAGNLEIMGRSISIKLEACDRRTDRKYRKFRKNYALFAVEVYLATCPDHR